MIKAFVFDLDGVIIQTEALKSRSYELAINQLCGGVSPLAVRNSYLEIVGASRQAATEFIIESLGLADCLSPLLERYDVPELWQAFSLNVYEYYDEMASDPEKIRSVRSPQVLGLIQKTKVENYPTALASLSVRREVGRALEALGIRDCFKVVLSAEDAEKPKPDPEIYLIAADKLGVQPQNCLVLEDSVNGIRSAQAAGMQVIALATPFTEQTIDRSRIIPEEFIVRDLDRLDDLVNRLLNRGL